MLTPEDVTQIDNSVAMAYQGEYTTPSGPFLDILRGFAEAGRIQDMSYAMQYYFTREPDRRPFVVGRLSGIIVNKHFPTVPKFDMSKFARWSVENPEWAAGIVDAFKQATRFEAEVQKVITESQK